MTNRRTFSMTFTRRISRLAAGLGIAGTAVLLIAGPAAADTSKARAKAAYVAVLGATAVDTGQVVATNGGSGETKTGATSTTILPGQTLLTAGVLAQDATARNNGTSAACAGALGQGGIIQIGPAGGCTTTIGTPAGVTVNLTPGLITLGADAIFAECTASSSGALTGKATIANANIFLLGQPLPTTLSLAPTPNQGLNLPGIASLILNEQTTTGGALTVNALHISLLANAVTGRPAADIIIGSVTCGPNAITPAIPLVNGPALPAAGLGAVAVGGAFVLRRRRRSAA